MTELEEFNFEVPSAGQVVAARHYLGWSQADLGERAAVGATTVKRWEMSKCSSGDGPPIRLSTAQAIVRAFAEVGVRFGRKGAVEVVLFDETAQDVSRSPPTVGST